MLKKAEEKFRDRDNADNNNVKFELANVESLPYKDERRFDYVVDTFSMCVFEKADVALQEAKRVLKKGGKLLLFEHSRGGNAVIVRVPTCNEWDGEKDGKKDAIGRRTWKDS